MLDVPPAEKKLLVRALLITSVLAGFYLLYYHVLPAIRHLAGFILPFFTPFFIAVVIAALLEPTIYWVQRRTRAARGLSVLMVLGGSLIIIGLLVFLVISRLTVELLKLSNELPKYSQVLADEVGRLIRELQIFYVSANLPPQVIQTIDAGLVNGLNFVKETTGKIIDWLLGVLAFVPSGVLIVVFTLLAIYFFSRDKDIIMQNVRKHLSPALFQKIERIRRELEHALLGFLRAQIILMLITIVQTLAGLYLLGFDFAVTMAILVGLVDALPVLGPGAVFVPWILWQILNGELRLALGLGILYILISIVRQVLQPKIMSESIGLHPLEALFSLYMGLKAFGVAGVIIGPLLWVLIKTSWRAGLFTRH